MYIYIFTETPLLCSSSVRKTTQQMESIQTIKMCNGDDDDDCDDNFGWDDQGVCELVMQAMEIEKKFQEIDKQKKSSDETLVEDTAMMTTTATTGILCRQVF